MCPPVSHSPCLTQVIRFCHLPGTAKHLSLEHLHRESPSPSFADEKTKPHLTLGHIPESWPVVEFEVRFLCPACRRLGILPSWDPTSPPENRDLDPAPQFPLKTWSINNLCSWPWGCHLLRHSYRAIYWTSLSLSTHIYAVRVTTGSDRSPSHSPLLALERVYGFLQLSKHLARKWGISLPSCRQLHFMLASCSPQLGRDRKKHHETVQGSLQTLFKKVLSPTSPFIVLHF